MTSVNSVKNIRFLALFMDSCMTNATKRLLITTLLQTARNCLIGPGFSSTSPDTKNVSKRKFDFGILLG